MAQQLASVSAELRESRPVNHWTMWDCKDWLIGLRVCNFTLVAARSGTQSLEELSNSVSSNKN